MDKILFPILAATLICTASAGEEYSKYPTNKDGKVLVEIDNKKSYQRPEQVVIKLSPKKQDYYEQESYSQENPSSKSRYEGERNLEDKYIYEYPKDQQYSDENQYTYKQDVEEKLEKISQPVYVNLNVKKEERYIPESKKIDVKVNIDNEKQDEYKSQDQQYVSKLLSNYGEKPKKVLVNVKIRKEKDDLYEQEQYAPKKININVKISKVQQPQVTEKKEVRETVLDRIYKISKKYTGL